MSKTIKLNVLNILVFAITGLIFIIGSTAIHSINEGINNNKKALEQHWRYEARVSLKNVINVFDRDIGYGIVDPYDEKSVDEWANINFSGIRNGSNSSRGWVGEIGKGIIISDQSILTSEMMENIKNPRYFSVEHKFYTNPEVVKKIYIDITKGDKTTAEDMIQWTLEGSNEWIEYKFYPGSEGLGGEYRYTNGVLNPNYKRYVFLMKTNAGEIYSKYDSVFIAQKNIATLIYITIGISFISCLTIMVLVLLKNNPVKDGGILYERR